MSQQQPLDARIASLLHSVSDPAMLDLAAYVRGTEDVPMSRSERLRRLAIYVEDSARCGDTNRDWTTLNRIYELAAAEDSADAEVFLSWGVAAVNIGQSEHNPAVAKRIFKKGTDSLLKALCLSGDNAEIFYTLGLCEYLSPGSDLRKAQDWFCRAIHSDPEHYMARMYVGHCLQDMRRWNEALEMYLGVDQERMLLEQPSWRVQKLRELISYCRLQLGDREGALRGFEALLSAFEKKDWATWDEELAYPKELIEAAKGELRGDLFSRTKICLEKLRIVDF